MKHFVIGAVMLLTSSGFAYADHVKDVPVLDGMTLMGRGTCGITPPNAERFMVPCELYLAPDGIKYVALYMDGKVQVVKRQNADGTQENVYTRVQGIAI